VFSAVNVNRCPLPRTATTGISTEKHRIPYRSFETERREEGETREAGRPPRAPPSRLEGASYSTQRSSCAHRRAAPCSSIQVPGVMLKRRAKRRIHLMRRSCAIVWANTQPEPGVAFERRRCTRPAVQGQPSRPWWPMDRNSIGDRCRRAAHWRFIRTSESGNISTIASTPRRSMCEAAACP